MKKSRSGNAKKNQSTQSSTSHSPRNGDIVNGRVYCRMYDFNRDAWYDLVKKAVNWASDTDKSKFVPTIMKKIKERIKNGRCTKVEVGMLMAELLNKSTRTKKVEIVEKPTRKTSTKVCVKKPKNSTIVIAETGSTVNIYNYCYVETKK